MLWGLDSASAPTLANAKALATRGWAFYGGYVGGRALHIWTKQEFADVSAAEFKLNAFWVSPLVDTSYEDGVNKGNACLVAMQDRGLSGWVQLDVESGAVMRQFAMGFINALHAGKCSVGLYGTKATINGMGDLFDSWYLAFYPTPNTTEYLPQVDWDQWQYSTGPQYDYNVARDTAPFAVFNS